FFHEDGQGNAMNEDGREPVLSEVDLEALPLDTITNFDIHSDLKPPEKDVKQKAPDVVDKRGSAGKTERRIIRKHGDDIRALSFFHVYEKGLSISKAAKTVGIPPKTADNWYKADQAEIEKRFKTDQDNPNYKKKKKILGSDHKEFLQQTYGDNPSATVDQAVEALTQQFKGLKVSPSTVRRYMK
ncbi:hypothetical protein J3Q64DRAFT_1611545, partial [Phycomyces blakesleeanus]